MTPTPTTITPAYEAVLAPSLAVKKIYDIYKFWTKTQNDHFLPFLANEVDTAVFSFVSAN